jgi:serine/threonine protein kinase
MNQKFSEQFEKSNHNSSVEFYSAISAFKLEKAQISDFKILDLVGTGNFGKVHKAFNLKQNRECALKILLKESVLQMK